MSDAQALATSYLSPSTDSLWRWSADGEVLTWGDGTTIAFRAEVEAVLRKLAPAGLPRFGAVAMLLAACRDGWENASGREAFLRHAYAFSERDGGGASGGRPHASRLVFQRVAQAARQIVDGLDAVGRLPPELRQSIDAKSVLAETVFEAAKSKRLTAEEAARVVQALEDGVNAERLTLRSGGGDALREFADDADALREGLPRVSEQSLALRRRTGLDELPREAGEDLAPADRVRRLLAELRQDPNFSGLARLAHDLMAAVHVPRTLRHHEELPVGGVSDLSNRGPLDRLLVSELAHDDLTLAVRVAVNEALYLRRESPPRQPPNRRAILIDSGIRTWGVPRVYGMAVALALVATADPHAELAVYRATVLGAEPADITTRRGLVACLEALDPSPHPGAPLLSLSPVLRGEGGGEGPGRKDEGGRMKDENGGNPPAAPSSSFILPPSSLDTDLILITHRDVLHDRDFTAAVQKLDDPAFYVAAVDRDGSFELLVQTAAGRKTVREAKLDLDRILFPPTTPGTSRQPGQAGSRLIVKDLDPDLPSILALDPLPLRLPYVADPKMARASKKHGLIAVTRDGRLLQWDQPKLAARQLTALLPAGKWRGTWIDDALARAWVLFEHTRGAACRLITADLTTGHATSAPIQRNAKGPMFACAHAGVLYLVFRQKGQTESYEVEAYDLATGAPHGRNSFVNAVHLHDRFFRCGALHALAHNGERPVLVKVTFPDADDVLSQTPILSLFDRAGHDGPWAVLRDGRILDATGKVFHCRFGDYPWKFVAASADGGRIVLHGHHGHTLLDLDAEGPYRPITADVSEELLVPQIYWSTRFSAVVRNNFDKIYADRAGRLSLVSPKGTVFKVATNEAGEPILKEITRTDVQGTVEFRGSLGDGRPLSPRGMRFELTAATWADGSRAYLDSRGMLHLKSSDPSMPEVSLVLASEKLAAWSSDGRFYGSRQFIGDATAAPVKECVGLLRHFVSRLRRA